MKIKSFPLQSKGNNEINCKNELLLYENKNKRFKNLISV
jgi:hypothetical protein